MSTKNFERRESTEPAPELPPLDFEFTDTTAARLELEKPPAGVKELRPRQPSDWSKHRQQANSSDNSLSPSTVHWLAGLPAEIRPTALPERHARLANLLASAWHDARATLAILDDLLVDRRGGRKGFPLDIALELSALRDLRMSTARLGN